MARARSRTKRTIASAVVLVSVATAAWSKDAVNYPPGWDIRGIYVDSNRLTQTENPTLLNALNTPGVDGLVLVLAWDSIEPYHQKYQWELPNKPQILDYWIEKAIAANKKVEITIPSDRTPDWLTAAKIQTLDLEYTPQAGATGKCTQVTIAVPWDQNYNTEWGIMLKALSDYLKSKRVQGVREYDAVTLLRLTGIDEDSDELHLPSRETTVNGKPCGADNISKWNGVHYSLDLLTQGWDRLTDGFKANFGDKIFSVAIIDSTYPFPAIGDTKIKGLSVRQNTPMLELANAKFPGHLVIQNNSLYEDIPAQQETIDFAKSLGTMIAFQTNLKLHPQGGASCTKEKGGGQPCKTWQDFLYLLNTGIYPERPANPTSTMRAQYIEVFAPNVIAFPDAIIRAHDELFAAPNKGPPGINPCPRGVRYCT